MTTVALKARPAARIAATQTKSNDCPTIAILRELAQEVRHIDRLRAAGNLGKGAIDDTCAKHDELMARAARSVPRSELGFAFLQLTLFAHSFTLNGNLIMPDLIRKCAETFYRDMNEREDLRLAAALQLARRAVDAANDPDLTVVAKTYLPRSIAERREMLKSCGVGNWRSA